jgi:hypothetical protein
MKKIIIICLLSQLYSTAAFSAIVTGTVTKVQVHSDTFKRPGVRGYMFFQLSSPLVDYCSWLSIRLENDHAVSALLSSRKSQTLVTVIYDAKKNVEGWVCSAGLIEI